jgi:chemotaxis protein MotB
VSQELPRRQLLWLPALALSTGCAGAARRQQDLIGQLDREIIAMGMENARLREQVRTCDQGLGEPPKIYTELVQVFAGMEVQVERMGQTTRVRLPGGLLFSSGSVTIRQESDFALDLLSTALNLHMDRPVDVIGHTDDRPTGGRLKRTYPTNWELSAARAAAVARSLIEDWGVSPHRFTVGGRGEWEPVADNDTPEGRGVNRRVDVFIHPPKDDP